MNISKSKEYRKEYARRYNTRPEVKVRNNLSKLRWKSRNLDHYNKYVKEYNERPEIIQKKKNIVKFIML